MIFFFFDRYLEVVDIVVVMVDMAMVEVINTVVVAEAAWLWMRV